jgi:hypothetical protein
VGLGGGPDGRRLVAEPRAVGLDVDCAAARDDPAASSVRALHRMTHRWPSAATHADTMSNGDDQGGTSSGSPGPAGALALVRPGSVQEMVNDAVSVAAELSPAYRSIAPGSTTKALWLL